MLFIILFLISNVQNAGEKCVYMRVRIQIYIQVEFRVTLATEFLDSHASEVLALCEKYVFRSTALKSWLKINRKLVPWISIFSIIFERAKSQRDRLFFLVENFKW